MLKKKKIVIGVGASLLTLMLIVGVMKFNSQPEVEPQMQFQNTYVVPNQKKVILSGSVIPSQYTTFTKDVTKGEEMTINVSHGDSVQVGDVLITYHNAEITSQINDLNEQIATLNAKKAKLSSEGTPAAKSVNRLRTKSQNYNKKLNLK